MEKYSVLMSLYKKEKPEYLVQAIDSMLQQTIKPDEIVIVEDGPLTKELYEVLDKYNEQIIRVKNEKNLGLGLALNVGLSNCRNELVARMDTDDIANLNRCELQLRCFEQHEDVSVVGGQIAEFINNKDNIVGKRIVPLGNKDIYNYLKKRCPFNHMTVMFRKQDIIEVGNYIDFYWNEDYYLWIRLALGGKVFANLDEVLVYARVGEEMYQRRGGMQYFKSEKRLQEYMLEQHIINRYQYIINVFLRFLMQVIFPTKLRGVLFRLFARKKR